MQKHIILCRKASSVFGRNMDEQLYSEVPTMIHNLLPHRGLVKSCHLKAKFPSIIKTASLYSMKVGHNFQTAKTKGLVNENMEELSDEEDEVCPVDCVREFKTDEEFLAILEKAKKANALVVVDFYRTACGSCKYIEKGFAKICKGAGGEEAAVIFLKHNVIDEYDDQSEVAERLRIKAVPLFHFYKDGTLLEAFPTRDKERILAAILKYSANASRNS